MHQLPNSTSVCKKSEVHQLALHIWLLCLQSCPSFAFICTDDTGTLQRFCRVHPLRAGRFEQTYFHEARVSGSWLYERERGRKREKRERQKQACDSLSYPLDVGLCDLNHSRERPLSSLHVQTGCHFYFAELLFSPHRRRALKYEVLTLTKKEALCLYLMLIEFGTFCIADMLFLLKLFLLFLAFGPVLLNEGGWLIKVARFEIDPRLRACISYTAFHVCVWRAFSIIDLWIHFIK